MRAPPPAASPFPGGRLHGDGATGNRPPGRRRGAPAGGDLPRRRTGSLQGAASGLPAAPARRRRVAGRFPRCLRPRLHRHPGLRGVGAGADRAGAPQRRGVHRRGRGPLLRHTLGVLPNAVRNPPQPIARAGDDGPAGPLGPSRIRGRRAGEHRRPGRRRGSRRGVACGAVRGVDAGAEAAAR